MITDSARQVAMEGDVRDKDTADVLRVERQQNGEHLHSRPKVLEAPGELNVCRCQEIISNHHRPLR